MPKRRGSFTLTAPEQSKQEKRTSHYGLHILERKSDKTFKKCSVDLRRRDDDPTCLSVKTQVSAGVVSKVDEASFPITPNVCIASQTHMSFDKSRKSTQSGAVSIRSTISTAEGHSKSPRVLLDKSGRGAQFGASSAKSIEVVPGAEDHIKNPRKSVPPSKRTDRMPSLPENASAPFSRAAIFDSPKMYDSPADDKAPLEDSLDMVTEELWPSPASSMRAFQRSKTVRHSSLRRSAFCQTQGANSNEFEYIVWRIFTRVPRVRWASSEVQRRVV